MVPKIKIISDGPLGARVYDENGDEIKFIESIDIKMGRQDGVYGSPHMAYITLIRQVEELEVEADLGEVS